MNLLNFIGVGTVVENKPENTYFCKVSIKKEFPQMDGAGIANAFRESVSNPTGGTGFQSSNVMKSNFCMPKWMPFSANRLTAPDVRVGSQVAIYKFADDDQLYWTTWGIGNESFRLEHILYAWNANPNTDKNAPFDFNSYYTLVISTRHQEVVFKTTQANGEPCAYRFGFNTKNGTWAFTDTEQNAFALNSMKHQWVMRNREGSIFNITKKDISMINKGTQLFEAEKSINMKTDKFFVKCNEFTMDAGTMDVTTNSLTMKAKKTQWTGDTIHVKCPTNSIEGNVGIKGNLAVQGGISCSGGAGKSGGAGSLTTTGGIVAQGKVESQVDVIAGNISLKNHKHNDGKGRPCSAPF